MTEKKSASLIFFALLLIFSPLASADDATPLHKGDLLAICGDSITEQKMYSVFIEEYLLACQPSGIDKIRALQAGWGGETASGFHDRMTFDVLPLKPTVATICYGMNDGGYHPIDQATSDNYRKAVTDVVETFKSNGVRTIVIGSPGVVDSGGFFGRPTGDAEYYNKALGALADVARDVALKEGVLFADLHTPMTEVMAKAKAKYGEKYRFAGGDGVHPGSNGHLVMAYAFLKALGCDGDIGTISVDFASNQAVASPGHTIISMSDGEVKVTSTRYPFCFYGKPEEEGATTGIIDFFPFNQDLNRFNLIVKNAGEEKIKVTWGSQTKEFSAAQAATGINLAAEFTDNPFSAAFQKLDQAVRDHQSFETGLTKESLLALHRFEESDPEEKDALLRIRTKLLAKDEELYETTVKAREPVSYSIKIVPVKSSR